MANPTTTEPTSRTRRPAHSRRPIPKRRQRFVRVTRYRVKPLTPAEATTALAALITGGNLFKVGRTQYLVSPVSPALLDTLIVAAGAVEDDEPNGDLEPSIGTEEDREGDGLEDRGGGEAALGWANEGSQEYLHCDPWGDENEPELGWSNGGPQLRLAEGYDLSATREGDGNCDDEPDADEPDGDEGDYSSYSRNIEDRHYIEAARQRVQARRQPVIANDGSGRRWRFVPVDGGRQ